MVLYLVTSSNIHINFRLKAEKFDGAVVIVGELQLLLENFVLAKDLEHKYYEIRRAENLKALLSPIF